MKLKTMNDHFQEQSNIQSDYNSDFEKIITDLSLAAKLIRTEISRSGISDQSVSGSSGVINSSGEDVQGLDLFSNEIIKSIFSSNSLIACLGSEEEDDVVLTNNYESGNYVILFDPLDGSSNIDVNVSVGTIVSVFNCNPEAINPIDHCCQKGSQQVLAAYVLYGPSTKLIYTSGHSVHEFTYDPTIGEFLLTADNITIPNTALYYSINDSLYSKCNPDTQLYIDQLKLDGLSARYVGSLVADFHRNLLKGGVYLYPGTESAPNGKLRLLYEANPLAFIIKAAGGLASDGVEDILDITPTELHQRTPLYIGSNDLISIFFSQKKTPNLAFSI